VRFVLPTTHVCTSLVPYVSCAGGSHLDRDATQVAVGQGGLNIGARCGLPQDMQQKDDSQWKESFSTGQLFVTRHAGLQVLCDLACFYGACVGTAEPQPGVPGAVVKVRVAAADTPAAFAAAAQTLRDTKHFVKDYGGGSALRGEAAFLGPPPCGALWRGARQPSVSGLQNMVHEQSLVFCIWFSKPSLVIAGSPL